MCAGVVLLFASRLLINRTPVADWLVSPLLVDDTNGKADAIIVMGAGVLNDCVPNNNGVRRVLLATRLWREGRAPLMVFTGGSGTRSCPVAFAMSRLAHELGVPDEAIEVETASLTTHENGERSAPVLDGLSVRRLLVVTDRLHMRRAAGTFTHLGFEVQRTSVPIYEGHTDNVSMLRAGARESVALAYYWMRGWLGPANKARTTSQALQTEGTGETRVRTRDPVMKDVSPVRSGATGTADGKGAVVVLGASYASGWGTPEFAGLHVINKGIGGQQSFEMLERFETDVVGLAPRAVILWGFINDLHRSAPESIDATLHRIRDSYTRMIDLSRERGIDPIVATEVTIRPQDGWKESLALWLGSLRGKRPYQDSVNARVVTTNEWLIGHARDRGVLVLDFFSVLRDDAGRRRSEFALPDGSHITAAGYAALTAYSRPVLSRHFAAQSGS